MEDKSGARHPFLDLLNLIFLVLAGTLLFTLLGFFVSYLIYGNDVLHGLRTGDFALPVLKIIQLCSSIGTFIVPAILFAKQQHVGVFNFLDLKRRLDLRLIILAIVILYVFTPFIDWTILANQKMKLPEFLKGIESWMRAKEDQIALLTKQFLVMTSPADLFVNLLIIAVVPAIGEELLFRACVQKIFTRWTRNFHAGIWVAAIIFSAIHVQFYGFVPRLLLGSLFGYLFYFSRNLWVPIIAHFVNNGTQVILAFILQRKGQSVEMLNEPGEYPFYLPFVSLLFTSALLLIYFRLSPVKKEFDERRLG
ncbi:CPBP family intramembrane glutamic endopeptidase [Desertivirga xinjiangensis]|uniref:CPBP family intramembrane glutamic endopeptidase n=1 Tax=Desertivirga xinjiangensis TaxID=539206 RepID=UPI00210E2F38|nr:CPBP family intramembrane glutamic endopeptidase [Pedobacter xinjiangensis]